MFLFVKQYSYSQRNKGGALLGCVITIPLLLFLVLAFVDISRICAFRSLLIHAAKESLTYAQTLPNLDLDDHLGVAKAEAEGFNDAFELLSNQVLTEIRKHFPGATLNPEGNIYLVANPDIQIPTSEENFPRRDKLRDNAIRITIRLHVNSFVGFLPGYNISGSVSGYRELGPWFKYDRPVDGSAYITESGSQIISAS